MRDFKARATIFRGTGSIKTVRRLPCTCPSGDGVAAITMAWSASGSVAEEVGEVPCAGCSVSGPFSSRVLRAAKTIEPEDGCDLWEATVGVHMHK
jgi:hypothetical protein